jgi:hypothetical protein
MPEDMRAYRNYLRKRGSVGAREKFKAFSTDNSGQPLSKQQAMVAAILAASSKELGGALLLNVSGDPLGIVLEWGLAGDGVNATRRTATMAFMEALADNENFKAMCAKGPEPYNVQARWEEDIPEKLQQHFSATLKQSLRELSDGGGGGGAAAAADSAVH